MPHRFCAICGKTIDKSAPHFGTCLDCYLKEHPLFELPKTYSLKICLDCGSYSTKEDWIKSEKDDIFLIVEEAIAYFLLKSFLKDNKIDFIFSVENDSLKYTSKDLIISMDLVIDGSLKKDIAVNHQQIINLNLNYELCRNCSNIRSGTYFLSIIQLRVKNETYFNIINEALGDIQKYVEKMFEKDQRQYITKIIDQKYGVDLYLSTNELMNHIIKFLKLNNHFILKRSKKLVGRDSQKGRNIYRLKSLIKFLPINKKDIIVLEDKEFIVESFSKNKVLLRSEQGTKLIKDYSYFFNEKISKKQN